MIGILTHEKKLKIKAYFKYGLKDLKVGRKSHSSLLILCCYIPKTFICSLVYGGNTSPTA